MEGILSAEIQDVKKELEKRNEELAQLREEVRWRSFVEEPPREKDTILVATRSGRIWLAYVRYSEEEDKRHIMIDITDAVGNIAEKVEVGDFILGWRPALVGGQTFRP